MRAKPTILLLLLAGITGFAQSAADNNFRIALPDHPGQLVWPIAGFKVIESSAKPQGQEIGLRGRDPSGRMTSLGFLFLFPELAPLTSAKCRDGVIGPEKKSNASMKVLSMSETAAEGGLPVSLVSYSTRGKSGMTLYMVRGFVAAGDLCGDLEFESETPIKADDPDLKKIFAGYRLDPTYVPQFADAFIYAQILYRKGMYKAAAPIFEKALAILKDDKSPETQTQRRVATDQAGMSYGIAGDNARARAIFDAAIAKDPDYPMYYYMLACADAGEKKLADARNHLQQAFDRKANVLAGESMPDPTQDDSFLPYRNNKGFWTFLQSLH